VHKGTFKVFGGSRIPNLGTWYRRVASFTSRPVYSREINPWYQLKWRLCLPHSRSGRFLPLL